MADKCECEKFPTGSVLHLAECRKSKPAPYPRGPWNLDADGGNCDDLLTDAATGIELAGITYAGRLSVAECERVHDLIAAAPDLLDALYGVAFQTQSEVPGGCWCSGPYRKCNPDRHSEACEFARAAIAKAVRA